MRLARYLRLQSGRSSREEWLATGAGIAATLSTRSLLLAILSGAGFVYFLFLSLTLSEEVYAARRDGSPHAAYQQRHDTTTRA